MARCKECIHDKVCLHKANIQTDTYAYMGVNYDTAKCEHYKPTADVVPKSESLPLDVHEALKQRAVEKAITEFADRLKPKVDCEYGNKFYRDKCFEKIDNLVKKMTGGK